MGRVGRPSPLPGPPSTPPTGTPAAGKAPGTAPATPAAEPGAGTSDPKYPPSAMYADPRTEGGLQVDHCVTPGTNSGQAGADLFCQKMGFTNASSFQSVLASPTYVVGAEFVCPAGAPCYALKNVKCEGRTGERTTPPPTTLPTARPIGPPPRDISSPPATRS